MANSAMSMALQLVAGAGFDPSSSVGTAGLASVVAALSGLVCGTCASVLVARTVESGTSAVDSGVFASASADGVVTWPEYSARGADPTTPALLLAELKWWRRT